MEEFNKNDLKVADKVADEILIRKKDTNVFLWVLLILLVLLVSFFSLLIFSNFSIHDPYVDNYIQTGSILFSFEEGNRAINIDNALPTSDDIGKQNFKEGEYFTFGVATSIKSKKQSKITYEISLTPNITTLDSKYVRIYLLEDGKEILINNRSVNNYADLPNSSIRPNSKVLYKTTVLSDSRKAYTFKMWLSKDYELDEVKRIFSCYVNVDAY